MPPTVGFNADDGIGGADESLGECSGNTALGPEGTGKNGREVHCSHLANRALGTIRRKQTRLSGNGRTTGRKNGPNRNRRPANSDLGQKSFRFDRDGRPANETAGPSVGGKLHVGRKQN